MSVFLVIANAGAYCGLEVNWVAEPVPESGSGLVRVRLLLPEEELLFASTGTGGNGAMMASWEATAVIDMELNARLGGIKPRNGEPLELELEIEGVQPGAHDLAVSLTDRESGQSWHWENSIEVPLETQGWNPGTLQIPTGRV